MLNAVGRYCKKVTISPDKHSLLLDPDPDPGHPKQYEPMWIQIWTTALFPFSPRYLRIYVCTLNGVL
jgi:hypothetical protein